MERASLMQLLYRGQLKAHRHKHPARHRTRVVISAGNRARSRHTIR